MEKLQGLVDVVKPPELTATGSRPVLRYRRVLCVIETIGLGGGAEQLLVTLLPALRNCGINIELVALFPWEPDLGGKLEAQGIKVHRLNVSGTVSSLKAVLKLRALIAKGGYDIVWSNLRLANIYARAAAMFAGRPKTVVTFHSEGYAQLARLSLKTRVSTTIEKILLGGADAKVAVSRAVSEDYRRFFGWDGFDVIYNCVTVADMPVPPSAEQRKKLRARHGISDEDILFVVPARYVEKKGHSYLLDALTILKDEMGWKPVVLNFGEGPLKNSLAGHPAATGVGPRVVFHDPVPHGELFSLMQSADGVVLPSLREPFGIAAAEAMALGVPVILTRTDGFLEINGDSDSALMVPVGDPRALAEAMYALVNDPNATQARAARARARIVNTFDTTIIAEQWVALFDRIWATTRDRTTNPSAYFI